MILFVFLISSLYSIVSLGAPVACGPDTAVLLADETPQFLVNYRSTIQIIWTCSAIIFASSWVCIHPNVPGYKSTREQRWGIRGRLFLNALLFPDQFVQRAFKEWLGARALHSQMREHIVAMQRDKKVKHPEAEQTEAQRRSTEGLRKREQAIGDHGRVEVDTESVRAEGSQTDGAKAEKAGDKLDPAPRHWEWTMVHAHFIHMGGVVFKGPKGDVWYKDFKQWTLEECKCFLDLMLTKDKIQDRSKADALAKAFVIVQCLWFVVQCIGRAAYGLPLTELEVTCLAFIACNIGMYAFWWNKPLNVVCPEEIQSNEGRPNEPDPEDLPGKMGWFSAVVGTLATGDIGLLMFRARGWDDVINPVSPRFPVNYRYQEEETRAFVEVLGQVLPLAIFGALHAIAWFAAFPSRTERILWRASSIAPAILASITLALFAASHWLPQSQADNLGHMAAFIVVTIIPPCFAARLAFIVLPVFQLRDLPSLAHQTVPWSDFLPHV